MENNKTGVAPAPAASKPESYILAASKHLGIKKGHLFAVIAVVVSAAVFFIYKHIYLRFGQAAQDQPVEYTSAPAQEPCAPPKENIGSGQDRILIKGLAGMLPSSVVSLPVSSEAANSAAREISGAVAKYKDSKIMQQLIHDLQADPFMEKLKKRNGKLTMADIAAIRKNQSRLRETVEKYMHNPEFVALLKTMRSDPELARAISKVSPMAASRLKLPRAERSHAQGQPAPESNSYINPDEPVMVNPRQLAPPQSTRTAPAPYVPSIGQ